jgi:class 3 adenylate cyclase
VHILAHLGTVTNKAIGDIFGVGYTAVTEAVKRAASLLVHNKKLKEKVNRLLIDI